MPQLFGRYLLIQRLSSGGMGEIFLAKHGLAGFEKVCVIKKILPHLSEDEHFISRFVDEAQVAIQLQHTNVAQVFEVGRVDDDYFLSLEFVAGCDARRIITQLQQQGQVMPADMAVFIGREVAAGLSYAHRRTDANGDPLGLVHCDISPPNIMMSFEGEVKVIDFGIAKSALAGTATDPKVGFGKLGYMAPEQLLRGGQIDARTDVYATGAVLFELLTGARLYDPSSADFRELARRVIRGQHVLPSAINHTLAKFDPLVDKALQPDPNKRFQSAAELRDAIQTQLVELNPTLSSEYAGGYLRRLFRGERDELRQLLASAQHADLGPWQAELAKSQNHTISFAFAPLTASELGPMSQAQAEFGAAPHPGAAPAAAPHPASPPAPAPGAPPSPRAEVALPPSSPLAPQLQALPYAPAPAATSTKRSRRTVVAVAAAAALALTAAAALAISAGSGAPSPDPDATVAAERDDDAPPTVITGRADQAVVPRPPSAADAPATDPADDQRDGSDTAATGDGDGDGDAGDDMLEMPDDVLAGAEADSDDDDGRIAAGSDAPSDGDGDGGDDGAADDGRAQDGTSARERAREERRKRRRERRARRRAEQQSSKELTSAEVKARFRSVTRDYQEFKKNYGARFERDWADLAQAAQFAGNDADNLQSLAQAIARFRAKMRSVEQ
ncbi:MAG: hypothetical protein Tsb0020_43920 [Haliangiales bacterium]